MFNKPALTSTKSRLLLSLAAPLPPKQVVMDVTSSWAITGPLEDLF